MKILHIEDRRIDVLLSPVVAALEDCWWWVNGDVEPPGSFARVAGSIGGDWNICWATDDSGAPRVTLAKLIAQNRNFFSLFQDVPAGIVLIARIIDGVYWDFFFRDDWMHEAVWNRLKSGSLTNAPWLSFDSETAFQLYQNEQMRNAKG